MKKIIALVVAIVMMAAMAVPTFAAISVNGTDATNSTSTSTLLEYGVAQVYEVTIPESVNLNAETPTASVALANGFCLPFGESLKISVNNSKSAWLLTDTAHATNEVEYTVKKGETEIEKGDIVLEVAAAEDSSNAGETATLSFVFTMPSYAGTYQDTLTFTAALGAPTSNS